MEKDNTLELVAQEQTSLSLWAATLRQAERKMNMENHIIANSSAQEQIEIQKKINTALERTLGTSFMIIHEIEEDLERLEDPTPYQLAISRIKSKKLQISIVLAYSPG